MMNHQRETGLNVAKTTASWSQTWQQLNGLTLQNFGEAPRWLKGLVLLLIGAFVLGFGWLFLIKPAMLERQALMVQEQTLVSQYAQKYAKATQLSAMQTQTQLMNGELSGVLERLPNAFNMSGLVEQLHMVAQRAGVQIIDVKVRPETPTELLVERELVVVAVGDYHRLGRMLAQTMQLPVLLTFHDFQMSADEKNNGDVRLTMQVKTYRTLTAEEKSQENQGGEHETP